VKAIPTVSTTSFKISGLVAQKQYFFRVYIRRTNLPVQKSNELKNYSSILENLTLSGMEVPLMWRSKAGVTEYDGVKLYRSLTPINNDKLIPAKEFTSPSIGNYSDTVPSAGLWYYRLYYYSKGVLTGESNQIVTSVTGLTK